MWRISSRWCWRRWRRSFSSATTTSATRCTTTSRCCDRPDDILSDNAPTLTNGHVDSAQLTPPATAAAATDDIPIIPEDVIEQQFLETGIQRLNVFDGDEFDIMRRDDVDLSRVHLGKRRAPYRDLGHMLDDKTHVRTSHHIYDKYNLVCDEVAMYSDEYDDTYDAEAEPEAADGDPEDARRPFVTPRVLAQRPETESEEEVEEVTQKEQEAASSRNRLDFCVNPEELRARREAAYQAKRGAAGRGARPQAIRSTDVVGRARGQGQEREVLANRERKEKHKSSRANHNRRQGAQAKRSRGMLPS